MTRFRALPVTQFRAVNVTGVDSPASGRKLFAKLLTAPCLCRYILVPLRRNHDSNTGRCRCLEHERLRGRTFKANHRSTHGSVKVCEDMLEIVITTRHSGISGLCNHGGRVFKAMPSEELPCEGVLDLTNVPCLRKGSDEGSSMLSPSDSDRPFIALADSRLTSTFTMAAPMSAHTSEKARLVNMTRAGSRLRKEHSLFGEVRQLINYYDNR